jgi:putative polyhydroxyalkanoate system protein
MSDIVIRRAHGLTPAKAKKAAEKIAGKLGEEFDLEHAWDEKGVMRFRRAGVSGDLTLHKHEVEIRVRLSILLLAIKPRVEKEIHKFFDENFGRESKTRV